MRGRHHFHGGLSGVTRLLGEGGCEIGTVAAHPSIHEQAKRMSSQSASNVLAMGAVASSAGGRPVEIGVTLEAEYTVKGCSTDVRSRFAQPMVFR